MPKLLIALLSAFLLISAPLAAQQAASDTGSDAFLKVYFNSGSSRIEPDQIATLDLAARTYREGNPFVMVVAGGADTVGSASDNLQLSLARANSVADALVARGIPVERLQVLGRGNSELEVPTGPGTAEAGNRVVEISWR